MTLLFLMNLEIMILVKLMVLFATGAYPLLRITGLVLAFTKPTQHYLGCTFVYLHLCSWIALMTASLALIIIIKATHCNVNITEPM